MRVLDLFCGAGGASKGYVDAGFEVVGVDIVEQPNYPYSFEQHDALTYPLDGFDLIHASPPCQAYSSLCRGMGIADGRVGLVAETRKRLVDSGTDYVIENVIGAPLFACITLCGSMFGLASKSGLWLRRHRLFETSFVILAPECQHPKTPSIGVYGNGTNKWHRQKIGRNVTAQEQREAMGIDWMTRKELSQAIPPAYTKFIGTKFTQCTSRACFQATLDRTTSIG